MYKKYYTLRRINEKGDLIMYPGEYETPEKAFKKEIILFLETDQIYTIYEDVITGGNKSSNPYVARSK